MWVRRRACASLHACALVCVCVCFYVYIASFVLAKYKVDNFYLVQKFLSQVGECRGGHGAGGTHAPFLRAQEPKMKLCFAVEIFRIQ